MHTSFFKELLEKFRIFFFFCTALQYYNIGMESKKCIIMAWPQKNSLMWSSSPFWHVTLGFTSGFHNSDQLRSSLCKIPPDLFVQLRNLTQWGWRISSQDISFKLDAQKSLTWRTFCCALQNGNLWRKSRNHHWRTPGYCKAHQDLGWVLS